MSSSSVAGWNMESFAIWSKICLQGLSPANCLDYLLAFVFCRKLYVSVSVLLCLLASGLVVFFLFPHSVLVDDNGIKVVTVWFDEKNSLVILAITVRSSTLTS